MSTRHDLKIWPEFFAPVNERRKTFEVRKNDRDFKVNDVLLLREWSPKTGDYTGAAIMRVVIYVMNGGGNGVEPGYVIMGLR